MPVTLPLPEKKKKTNYKPKVCPTCGGLECFERPRYFCGMLLNDKDLEAAQRYVIEKNKLHNRYLVGTGVVCGLAVKCHECEPCTVVVEPGYAIDCCGNDIVLCEPAEFDVCEYLKACKEPDPCNGKIKPVRSQCDDLPKEYCLYLSYHEEHTKPVTALIRDNGCKNVRCEPSRTAETFRIHLVEKKTPAVRIPPLDLTNALQNYLTFSSTQFGAFVDELGRAGQIFNDENRQPFHATVLSILRNMKTTLLDLVRNRLSVQCELADCFQQIEQSYPSLTETRYLQRAQTTMFNASALYFHYSRESVCEALLVPCGECKGDEGVLLACFTMQNDKILRINNGVRTPVITGPALRYWQFPLRVLLGSLLDVRCRGDVSRIIPTFFSTASHFATAPVVARNFSAATWKDLNASEWLQFVNPQTISAVELFNRPESEAVGRLRGMNVDVEIKRPIGNNAFSFGHLRNLTWIVMPGSKVDLFISPDPDRLVTGLTFQSRGGQ